nr:putative ribonuclease H-like domain-containing protein [Tanacetum cinerariifolium]
SQVKYEDINQIDEDDTEEIDIKFWKKTGKKITVQGTNVAGFDKSKVESFNCHKMGHFARECRAPRSQDRGRRENFKQGFKVEESAPKALMAIDRVEARLVEFKNQEIKFCEKIRGLEFKFESKDNRIERLTKELEELKKEKEGLNSKLTGFQSASKDLDTLRKPEGNSQNVIDDKGYWDNGCSRHMTGNISYLSDYEPYDGGFTWTFFLKTKDETSGILRNFITEIENLKELKVKIIRYDNKGEFRNKEMNDFCSGKGIKREFSNARTPQQNGVTKRRNRTLIEAARTMLADAKCKTHMKNTINLKFLQV